MSDVDARLQKCFSAVFPDLPPDIIPGATPSSVKTWDSVATVTLLAVVEEEFGVAIDIDELGVDMSYGKLRTILQQRPERA